MTSGDKSNLLEEMMKLKNLSVAACGLLFVGGVVDAREIQLGHTLSADSHYSVGSDAFKATLEELSGGEFTVLEHPAGSLGGERAMIEGLQIGTVDVVITSTGPLGNFVPETYVLDLPFLFEDYDHARAVLDSEIGDDLLADMEQHDIIGLAWSENGFRHMTNSRNEVHGPDDVADIKIRTMENQVHMNAFRELGASPTPMAFPELFTALQQGTVDAQENPVTVIVATKFWEVQDHISLTGHVYSPAAVLGSGPLWDTLSEEERGWFNEAARASAEATRNEVLRLETEGLDLLRENGMTVIEEVDTTPFQNTIEPVYEAFIERHGAEMLERIQNFEG